jgi:hypothetical protein
LLKYLDTWATRNEIKAETRAIQQEQRELLQETEKLAEQFDKLGGEPRALDDQFKATLKKNAELQRRLGERAQRLLDKMDRVSQDRADELAKLLEAAAKTEAQKKKVRELVQKWRDLKEQAQALETREVPTSEDKVALRKNAEQLQKLSEQLKSLMEKLDPATQDRAEKDLATAEMLDKSALIGKKEMLPGEAKDAGDQLSNPTNPQLKPQFNRAEAQQRQTIKNLDKMIEALEERREAEVERLAKKQRQAQKELAELMDRQERLQKRARDAMNLPDGEQRKEALQKLAEEQRKLEDEVAKKARELARLQASKAGQSLAKAGQKMDKAAKQMDRDEDPEEAQQEAKERLEEAQDNLQQARERSEDELAREQLAKIADQLKGLKERQDASIEESARIHKLLQQQNKWTRALRQSLGNHAKAQHNLANETKSLKEKVKGAIAFELVLDRSVRAMEAAVKRMKERDQGAEVQGGLAPFEPEELEAENRADAETQKRQREASRRLDHLLDALKTEDGAAQRPKKKADDKKAAQGGGQQGGGDKEGASRPPGDGIPEVAQLKALRSEQQEVNDRTKEFAELHPSPEKLDPAQREELQSIREDQERVFELFQRLVAEASGEGAKK